MPDLLPRAGRRRVGFVHPSGRESKSARPPGLESPGNVRAPSRRRTHAIGMYPASLQDAKALESKVIPRPGRCVQQWSADPTYGGFAARMPMGGEPAGSRCHTVASPVTNWCHTVASPATHRYHTVASPVIDRCHTVAAPVTNPCQTVSVANPSISVAPYAVLCDGVR